MSTHERVSQATSEGLSAWEIAKFYTPMAITTMFIAIIFNIMNSTMARLPDAAIALAAFTVGTSVSDLFSIPAASSQQWLMARGRDRQAFWHGLKVMMPLMFGGMGLVAVVAYTPLGPFLYNRVLGVPVELNSGINSVMRVSVIMPLVQVVRAAGQNILMLCRRTHYMAFAVILRLVYVLPAAWLLMQFTNFSGPLIGAILWVSGIGVEGLFNVVACRWVYHRFPSQSTGATLPSPTAIWRFLTPLIATNVLWSLGPPILNAGLAQTLDPELSLAVYQVTWNAAWLLIALIRQGYRKAVVVFWQDKSTLVSLESFSLRMALSITALMLILIFSGGADWFLGDVLGTPPTMVEAGRGALLIMAGLPLPLAGIEVCVGRLLRNGITGAIGLSKGANLATLAITLLFVSGVFPQAGAMVGAVGLLTGTLAEYAVAYYAVRSLDAVPRG